MVETLVIEEVQGRTAQLVRNLENTILKNRCIPSSQPNPQPLYRGCNSRMEQFLHHNGSNKTISHKYYDPSQSS